MQRYQCGGSVRCRLYRSRSSCQGISSLLLDSVISEGYMMFLSASCLPYFALCALLSCVIISTSLVKMSDSETPKHPKNLRSEFHVSIYKWNVHTPKNSHPKNREVSRSDNFTWFCHLGPKIKKREVLSPHKLHKLHSLAALRKRRAPRVSPLRRPSPRPPSLRPSWSWRQGREQSWACPLRGISAVGGEGWVPR